MKKLIFKNMANLVVLIRVLLIFLVIYLFKLYSLKVRIWGLIFLVVVALLDWLDGYVARKYNIESKMGAVLDTLGDRITENLLCIFFAYMGIVPLFMPLVFVARSFMADFIRNQSLSNGIGTFSINKSKLGMMLVASKPSRAIYLISKISVFFLAGLVLVVESIITTYNLDLEVYLNSLRQFVYYGAEFVVLFNIIRFILLIYDSRFILRNTFIK